MGPLEGKKIFVTRPRHQAQAFADRLAALGAEPILLAEVDEAAAVPAPPDHPEAKPDFITLTSSSAAKAALEGLAKEEWLRETPLVCIGPVTAATVREMGYDVAATAEHYTTDGIIKALVSLASDEPEDA